LPLTEGCLRKILGENAQKLLGLDSEVGN